ncbi:MAG: LysM peptidoglycan-binding domain-containing protein [Pseudomonadota bacterium]
MPAPSKATLVGLSLTILVVAAGLGAGLGGYLSGWRGIATPDADSPEQTAKAPETTAQDSAPAQSSGSPAPAEADQAAAPAAQPSSETAAGDGGSSPRPSVDIVRVEPTGDAVIAGQSEAGALVAVLSNGVVVGKGVANETGDWAIVLEKPLDPGSHDIAIQSRKTETADPVGADKSFAVYVPKDESEGVLVATNKPGAPTEILQAPDLVAAAPIPSNNARTTPAIVPQSPAPRTARSPATETRVAALPENTGTPGQGTAPDSGNRDAAPAPDPAETAAADDTRAGAVVAPSAGTPDVSGQEADGSEPEQAAPQTGTARSFVRSQTQDAVADRPSDEASDTSNRSAAPQVAFAAGTASAPSVSAASGNVQSEGSAGVTVRAVEVEAGQVYVAGESSGQGVIRVYIEDQYVGETAPNSRGQWILKAPKSIEAGQHAVRADEVATDDGKVTARAEVTFEREEDAIALTPVVAVGSGAASGTAGTDVDAGRREIPALIIRKGDNLWRISQRHYGEGIRYTTIYQANQGQIRDPDLIFPGQVFLLPQRDLNWSEN